MTEYQDEKLVRVFTGSQFNVNMLKGMLEQIGIESVIKDRSGMSSVGIRIGNIDDINILILESDMDKAQPLIDEFEENLKKENSISED